MKILIPILGFGRAGGYRVLSKLADEWLKQDHTVDFLCPDSSDEPYFPTSAKIFWIDSDGNISTARREIAKPSGWNHIKSLYFGIRAIGKNYDVILANQSLTAWPVTLASSPPAKKIYYVQAYEPEYYLSRNSIKGYLLAMVSAATYHLPLHRVVNAPLYFRYRNLRATAFVPPGIDLELFKPNATNRSLVDAEKIVIGCIGRHEPEKGTVFVLRAFEEIARKDERFMLRIAYGNLPAHWRHERCDVVVPKNDQELSEYYRSLDILVAPGTVQHGAPHYPVLEAAACGVAVVTSGYLGATAETAWITRNKDVTSIVKSVFKVASDDNSRIEEQSRFLRKIQQYSWEKVSRTLLATFNDTP